MTTFLESYTDAKRTAKTVSDLYSIISIFNGNELYLSLNNLKQEMDQVQQPADSDLGP
jgi:hypothetical protein